MATWDKLKKESESEGNYGLYGDNTLASLISATASALSNALQYVKNPATLHVIAVLEVIDTIAGLYSFIADDVAQNVAELKALTEELTAEREEILSEFISDESVTIRNESLVEYVNKLRSEAELIGINYQDLETAISEEALINGLEKDYFTAQGLVLSESIERLTLAKERIDALEVLESNADFQSLIDYYTGYSYDFGLYDGELKGRFDLLEKQYLNIVDKYIEGELLDQFEEDLNEFNNALIYDTSSFIKSEMDLVGGSDTSVYTESLNDELDKKKHDQQQEAQDTADNKTDNSELNEKLNDERSSYQREAEEVAQAAADRASQDVKVVLEINARQALENFFNELLQRAADEAKEELAEASCSNSHDKIYAWESEIRKQFDLVNDADIVSAQSEAASDNKDRKSRLEALISQTEQVWNDRIDSLLDTLENISEQEDPEDCGLPDDPSDKKVDFSNAEKITSPLVVDLDGDGIETLSQSEYIYFDHDGNGLAERTGWVSSDDGLLVIDRNGDGQITSGNELLGSNTQLESGTTAENGFVALSEYDENADAVIDQQDVSYSTIKVWQDLDSDGKVDVASRMII